MATQNAIERFFSSIFGGDDEQQDAVLRPKARPEKLDTGLMSKSLRPKARPEPEQPAMDTTNSFVSALNDFTDDDADSTPVLASSAARNAYLNGSSLLDLNKANRSPAEDGFLKIPTGKHVPYVPINALETIINKSLADEDAVLRPKARPVTSKEMTASYGYSGSDDVKDIQAALNLAGITVNGNKLAEDGVKGKNTSNAIKQFQKEQGLTVDGIVGKNTKAALYSVTNKSLDFGSEELEDAVIVDEGLMSKPSAAPPRAGIFTGAFRGFASLFESLSTAEGQAKALIKAAPLASKILPINAAKFAEFLGNEGKIDLTSDDLGKQNYNYLRKKALDVIKRGDDKFSYSDWGFEEKSVLVKDMTKTAWGSIKDPAFRMATLIGQTAPGNVRIENGRVLVEDVYDFNTGPLGKKMQKAFELREAGDEEGYKKLSSEALKGQTHLGQLRVWAAALGVPQGEGTRFTLDLGEAP